MTDMIVRTTRHITDKANGKRSATSWRCWLEINELTHLLLTEKLLELIDF